jgi:hypothetical protein
MLPLTPIVGTRDRVVDPGARRRPEHDGDLSTATARAARPLGDPREREVATAHADTR